MLARVFTDTELFTSFSFENFHQSELVVKLRDASKFQSAPVFKS
jgi:hypothetical protein